MIDRFLATPSFLFFARAPIFSVKGLRPGRKKPFSLLRIHSGSLKGGKGRGRSHSPYSEVTQDMHHRLLLLYFTPNSPIHKARYSVLDTVQHRSLKRFFIENRSFCWLIIDNFTNLYLALPIGKFELSNKSFHDPRLILSLKRPP